MLSHRLAIRYLVASAAIPFIAACGGGTDMPPAAGEQPEEAAAAAVVEDPATITGVINLAGEPAANEPIDMSEEPTCAEKHATPPTQQTVVAQDGKLANVFVYVKEGLTGTFDAPAEAAEINQDGCVYVPRVTGMMVGQDLAFTNSDGLLHNINASPANQPGFNISQPTTMTTSRQLRQAEVMVPIQCDVHGWMHAYVGVVDHPYFAVSAEDGSFTIANLPAGTYTLEAWHEEYGTQEQEVTVGANETVDVTFDYSASTAGAIVPLAEPLVVRSGHGAHGGASHSVASESSN